MDDIESERRRELLVGARAILANASVLGRAAFAASNPVKHGKRGRAKSRYWSSIAPDFKNPYFKAQSGPSSYFTGLLSNQAIDYQRVAGQYFPYTAHDLYGSKVLADSLGGIDPTTYFSIPPHLPADIIADAKRTS
jgi:hypothetical protein